jgi:hypothetical protein
MHPPVDKIDAAGVVHATSPILLRRRRNEFRLVLVDGVPIAFSERQNAACLTSRSDGVGSISRENALWVIEKHTAAIFSFASFLFAWSAKEKKRAQ